MKKLKKFFTYGSYDETALLNWTMHRWDTSENFHKMAVGYRMAAETVAKDLLKDNTDKQADKEIFPLMFLYEQATELYLKSILLILFRICGEKNNKEIKKQTKTHDLKELMDNLFTYADMCNKNNTCEKDLAILKDYVDERIYMAIHIPEVQDYKKDPENTEAYIQQERYYETELIDGATRDQRRDAFLTMRYPTDLGPNGYFYAETYDNVPVDIRYLAYGFREILNVLDNLQIRYSLIEENMKNKEEMNPCPD